MKPTESQAKEFAQLIAQGNSASGALRTVIPEWCASRAPATVHNVAHKWMKDEQVVIAKEDEEAILRQYYRPISSLVAERLLHEYQQAAIFRDANAERARAVIEKMAAAANDDPLDVASRLLATGGNVIVAGEKRAPPPRITQRDMIELAKVLQSMMTPGHAAARVNIAMLHGTGRRPTELPPAAEFAYDEAAGRPVHLPSYDAGVEATRARDGEYVCANAERGKCWAREHFGEGMPTIGGSGGSGGAPDSGQVIRLEHDPGGE